MWLELALQKKGGGDWNKMVQLHLAVCMYRSCRALLLAVMTVKAGGKHLLDKDHYSLSSKRMS